MEFQKNPRLALCWPACDAATVHVTFASTNWETPGIALERQLDGQFMSVIGSIDPFGEILFKFIIDGTEWKVNPSIPVVLDENGYENNRWTPSEAMAYHDVCVRNLRRRTTLARVDQEELCQLALSIHGQVDSDGRQLQCVIDETVLEIYDGASLKPSMSGLFNEIIFLRFQPLECQLAVQKLGDQLEPSKIEGAKSIEIGRTPDGVETLSVELQDIGGDVWVAKFPTDFSQHGLDGCESNSERERRMESECATMRFLNEHTNIPAPQLYGYDVRYTSPPDSIWKTATSRTSPDTSENKVGWPFMLMQRLGASTLLPYWHLLGDPLNLNSLLHGRNDLRSMVWAKLISYQIELAKHPLTACGYLTLNCSKWHIKNENNRRTNTPKSAFGIRPCIYNNCIPFTDSIVSAFDSVKVKLRFQPARASNSLNSVTARFQHLLTHIKVENENHFAVLWQLRALIYDIFGSRFENGPFILQHPDISPRNTLVSGGGLVVSGLINWEDTQAVPIQIAACPPGICLGRLCYDGGKTPLFLESALSSHQHEYHTCMMDLEKHMVGEGNEPVIWKSLTGIKIYLSQVLREEMVMPVYVLGELCSGSLGKSLTGNIAAKYFPLIYHWVKGYKWEDVKTSVFSRGAMRLALEDWEEEQKKKMSNRLIV